MILVASSCGDAVSSADVSFPFDGGLVDAGLTDAGSPDAGPAWCRGVSTSEEPGADWACTETGSCTADYLAFRGKAAQWRKPVTAVEIDKRLSDIEAGSVEVLHDAVAPDALRDAILDKLNMRFLVEGLEGRPFGVKVVANAETEEYRETSLLFEDPYVGTFKGLLLKPKRGRAFPGIVAIHGHGDDAAAYRDTYHGSEYPGRGYAVLMRTMRAMNIDEHEHAVTRALLLDGFNLIALRAYETMLGVSLMRCLPDVDPDRIGLIGHSGGSSSGNLVVRLDPRVKAYVSDHQVNWHSSGEGEPYHCETAPSLYPWHDLINDFSTSETSVLQALYGYVTGMDEIWQFFAEKLR
ncbi:MAG: hypothetical protein HY897_08270 [Deltaproteobacteria bacterium]|nr:hypothetical protein [Deltaproteobacteria bacterium]